MTPDGRYDVQVKRYGALGVLEIALELQAAHQDEAGGFLALQLNTLGPGDTAEITIARRRDADRR